MSTQTEAQTQTLSRPEVHEVWERGFRDPRNELFYERVFDELVARIQVSGEQQFLDIGCGPGFHAMRLARRGYRVRAVDFSPAALAMAAENIRRAGLQEQIELRQEDVTRLSFPDGAFAAILCWGVLMHVPRVDKAMRELRRVLAPGGHLILSERATCSPRRRCSHRS